MLDQSDAGIVTADVWADVEAAAKLVEPEEAYLSRQGPAPARDDTKRSFQRLHVRGKAALKRDQTLLGVYTKDISRKGIAFLSPVQIFPLEQVQLRIANGESFKLEVKRCRRLGESCYECGSVFVKGG